MCHMKVKMSQIIMMSTYRLELTITRNKRNKADNEQLAVIPFYPDKETTKKKKMG